ncbi:MAG: hypothetical protein AB7U85_07045 [Alphaproteobacteria bacterium]
MRLAKTKIVIAVLILGAFLIMASGRMLWAKDASETNKSEKLNDFSVFQGNSSKGFFASKIMPILSLSKKIKPFPYNSADNLTEGEDNIVPRTKPVVAVEVNNLEDNNKKTEKAGLVKGDFLNEANQDSSLITLSPLDFVLVDNDTLDMSLVDKDAIKKENAENNDSSGASKIVSEENLASTSSPERLSYPLPPPLPPRSFSDAGNYSKLPLPPHLPPSRQQEIALKAIENNKSQTTNSVLNSQGAKVANAELEELKPLIPAEFAADNSNINKFKKNSGQSADEALLAEKRTFIPINTKRSQKETNVSANLKKFTASVDDANQRNEDKSTVIASSNDDLDKGSLQTVEGTYLQPKKPIGETWQPYNLDNQNEATSTWGEARISSQEADNKEEELKAERQAKADIVVQKTQNYEEEAKEIAASNNKMLEQNKNGTGIKEEVLASNQDIRNSEKSRYGLKTWENRSGLDEHNWQPVKPYDLNEDKTEEPDFQFGSKDGKVAVAPDNSIYGERLRPVNRDENTNLNNKYQAYNNQIDNKPKQFAANVVKLGNNSVNNDKQIKKTSNSNAFISVFPNQNAACDLCDEYQDLDSDAIITAKAIPVFKEKDIVSREILEPTYNSGKELVQTASKQKMSYDENKKQVLEVAGNYADGASMVDYDRQTSYLVTDNNQDNAKTEIAAELDNHNASEVDMSSVNLDNEEKDIALSEKMEEDATYLNKRAEINESINKYREDGSETHFANAGDAAATTAKKQPLLKPIEDDMPSFAPDGKGNIGKVDAPVPVKADNYGGSAAESGSDEIASTSFMDKLSALFGGADTGAAQNSEKGTLEQASAMAGGQRYDRANDLLDQIDRPKSNISKISNEEEEANQKVIPSELRLFFDPGKSEMSGNTLVWLDKFAEKAAIDRSQLIEVRMAIDYTGNLQARRFALLQSTFVAKGVKANQVVPIFSSRPSDSIVLRMTKDQTKRMTEKLEDKGYINW